MGFKRLLWQVVSLCVSDMVKISLALMMLSFVVGGYAVTPSNLTVGQDYCGVMHKTREDCLADKDGICEWCTSPSPPGPICLTTHMTPDTFQCEKPHVVIV